MLADIVAFGSSVRSDPERMTLRTSLFQMLRDSLVQSGVPWTACYLEDGGRWSSGHRAARHPDRFVHRSFTLTFARNLAEHNKIVPASLHMQVRLAIDVGPVLTDAMGVSGRVIIRAARMVDSPAIKRAIGETDHPLGVIVSEFVYETTIRQGHPPWNRTS